ncbi:glycosyltransferase family 9 protein [Neptuniibacter sp.]|uniref:glycosyltransferase family 9 protein n=1 Tax=Neptuniibacter sp. TaxID=1962643 RepID=UPI00262AD4BA|nr:glycosyltransferase family 9 protein [Neptuniibacter sp.]MCP4595151.1 glycosyltransferase family 9 protein [Neptuniibacter sp.]
MGDVDKTGYEKLDNSRQWKPSLNAEGESQSFIEPGSNFPLVENQDFERLLVVMTDRHIGNLMVSLYAIQAVSRQLKPNQSLRCIVDSKLLGLAEYFLPEVEFIPFALRGKSPSLGTKLKLLFRLWKSFRAQKSDVAVDLYGHSESLKLAQFSGANYISAYYCRPKLKDQFDWQADNTSLKPVHQVDYYRMPFLPLIGPVEVEPVQAVANEAILNNIAAKLVQLGRDSGKTLLVIHPGAGKEYKLWPIKYWCSLIEKLEQQGYQILLIGSGADKDQVDQIVANNRISPLNGFMQFNLIETIHLGFIAKGFIGNDSGPAHLLATTPATVISLFGPTDAVLWAPLSPNGHVLRSAEPCLPECSKGECQRSVSCLDALEPSTVLELLLSTQESQ